MTPEALSACYREHHRRLYLVALAITMNRHAAEDAVHDALERLLGKNRRPDNLLAYVIRAVRNAAIDVARRRRREEPVPQEFFVAVDGPVCEISPRILAEAFGELRRNERETILLHVYADMSFREIADLRRRPPGTVAAWYRRGLTRLRRILKEEQ
jgi:RNA polymerase sigma factor (sigma-70 family)